MTLDGVISDELRAREPFMDDQVYFWRREYRLPFRVLLRRWFGDRWNSHTTGEVIWMSIPRYWLLYWRTKRARRDRNKLPTAVLRKARAR